MSTTIRLEFDAAKALAKRGLGISDRVQRVFTSECAGAMDRYVPMRNGILKNTADVQLDCVIYNQPYAHYHYVGELYLAPNGSCWAKEGERKVNSGRLMTYRGAPMRGPLWDKRMWADHRDDILNTTARECGGRYE